MRHVLALAAMSGLVSPAGALTIPTILCENANGAVADDIYVHDASDAWLPGMTTFTRRSARDDSTLAARVIVHCATRQSVTYADDMTDATHRSVRAAIEGAEAVTLRQLAQRMRAMGVEARFAKLGRDHCACRPETHGPSF